MEVPHTDLSEVTRVVLVHVGLVVVLTTGKTTTTGVLAVLADTSVTGGDVTAAVERDVLVVMFLVGLSFLGARWRGRVVERVNRIDAASSIEMFLFYSICAMSLEILKRRLFLNNSGNPPLALSSTTPMFRHV